MYNSQSYSILFIYLGLFLWVGESGRIGLLVLLWNNPGGCDNRSQLRVNFCIQTFRTCDGNWVSLCLQKTQDFALYIQIYAAAVLTYYPYPFLFHSKPNMELFRADVLVILLNCFIWRLQSNTQANERSEVGNAQRTSSIDDNCIYEVSFCCNTTRINKLII